MLVITRKPSESFMIGENVEVIISEISGDKVKICIIAPKEVTILRKELAEAIKVNIEASLHPNIKLLSDLNKHLKK